MLRFTIGGVYVEMAHTLVSIGKWEHEFQKPYLVAGVARTTLEALYYFDCMITNDALPNWELLVDHPEVATMIHQEINDTATATKIKPDTDKQGITLTAEVMYASMFLQGIPIEAERWHINKLLMVLAVMNELQKEKKPMSQQEIFEQNARLNAERREAAKSKG